ncbi:MAG: hypothetical protein WD052_03895 [Bacteroidales bacterium]
MKYLKFIYPVICLAGLLMLLIPSIMHFTGKMEMDKMKNLIFIGTVLWFAGAIPWLGKKTNPVV